MGEEWRRGWHPERIQGKKSSREILVVGGGPAGLEAARALGQRGYQVILVEAQREFGGRVHLESQLPGLAEWRHVVDWRLTQARKMPNISCYPGSCMSAADVLEAGPKDILIAAGSVYRKDGMGRALRRPVQGSALKHVFTPDDLMKFVSGSTAWPRLFEPATAGDPASIVIYDDDHYYMGGVLAELLAQKGCQVTIVTPAPVISYWTQFTLEQDRILARLLRMGVAMMPNTLVDQIERDHVRVKQKLTGKPAELPAAAVVLVTDRVPNDSLYAALVPALQDGSLSSLRAIGDAEAPNTIAQAVFSGHLAAREFDEPPYQETPFKVERITI
jgi:dimethylamine/trimethylamine dehydrogenase